MNQSKEQDSFLQSFEIVKNDVISFIGAGGKTSLIFKLAAVYAPMGLNIASIEPKEIALSIMSEILLVKNNGSAQHMKTVKDVRVLSD